MTYLPAVESTWLLKLRQINLLLLALLPLALLLSRGAADVVAVVIGVSFLLATILRRQWDFATDPMIAVLLITWLLLNFVVSPLAIDPAASFGRSLPWVRFVILFAATTTWLVRSHDDLKFIIVIWSVILAAVAIDGFIQLLAGTSASGRPIHGDRLTGPLDRPNIGIFVARLTFAVLAGWALVAIRRPRLTLRPAMTLMTGFAAVMIVFILLTGERAASLLTMFALITGMTMVIIVLPTYRMLGLIGLGVAVSSLAVILAASERLMKRALDTIDTLGNLWQSIYGELMSAGLNIWLEHPVAGVGLRNYNIACENLIARGTATVCDQHPHNMYVEWLAETGVVGFVGFLTFVLLLGCRVLLLLRQRDGAHATGVILVAGLIVALFPFTVSQSFFSNWPAILLWSSVALIAAIARLARETRPPSSSTS